MDDCSAKQLCFPPLAGQTIRADFEGGALSSDFGALLLRGIDRQIGLTERFAAAIHDKRHQSYIDHPLRDLLAQRIYQIASGYADGNDANSLRRDPLFKLSVERSPLDPEHDLASAPTLKTSIGSRRPWWTTSSLVTLNPLPPLSLTWIIPTTRRMGSRNLRSITITIRTIVICRSSFLKGPPMHWSWRTSALARGLPARRTR